ncbi:MAG: glycosyltransferase [bacterium]|nr:glycosyltransferase [bacterium]
MINNQKIKIIYIIPTLNIGGAERLVIDIAKNLNQEKFIVKIICMKRFGIWEQELKDSGIQLILLGQKRGCSFFSLIKLIRILKKECPDIVHTHLFGADFYGSIATRLVGIKYLVSTEHNFNYSEGLIRKIIKMFISKLFNNIIAVSEAVKNYVIKDYCVKSKKILVIYNGVDVNKFFQHFKKRENVKENRNIVIGSVGRLVEQKGFKYLIEAVNKLSSQNIDIECLIAGDGELKTVLLEKVKKLGLENKIKFLGSQKDIKSFLNKIDIFILPSLWEGFGLVILEAGLAGLPVIVSKVGGIVEIIEDKKDGLFVNPANSDDLAQKIKDLIEHKEFRDELAINLQTKVKNNFTIQNTVAQYEQYYNKLVFERQMSHKISNFKDVVLAVTYRCNSRCVMCNIWKKEPVLELCPSDYNNLPKNLQDINITGGEPFLRNDLCEIIEIISKRCSKANIVISTNGFATDLILSQTKKIIEIFPKIGIAISIDGIGEKHNETRGVVGGFEKSIKTIENLKKLGVKNLKIAFTLGDYNIKELSKVYNLANKLGVEFSLAITHSSENFFNKENKLNKKKELIKQLNWLIKKELSSWSLKKWARAYFVYGAKVYIKTGKRILPDYSGKDNLFIDPFGDIYASGVSSQKIGELRNFQMFSEIKNDQKCEQSWMVCTARSAIKKHWFRVIVWIFKNKFFYYENSSNK